MQANIVQVVQEYVPLKRAGHVLQGAVPVPQREDAVVQRQSREGLLPLLRLRRRRRRLQVSRAAREGRLPGRGADAGAEVRRRASRAGRRRRRRRCAARFGAARERCSRRTRSRRRISRSSWRRRPAAARAAQLAERGVTPQTIEQLGLGFAPNSRDGLKQRLLKQGFAQGVLLQSGLIVQRESGEVVDRFRNRLMVPICRDTGSVIAFGGRQMDADQGGPKYLNSPETPIYSKSRTLYGLNLTKAADPERSASRSWSRAISTSRRCFSRRRPRRSPPAAPR